MSITVAAVIAAVSTMTSSPPSTTRPQPYTTYTQPSSNVPRIEAITDIGPMLEMIVRCPKGAAIISYSKIERLFCDPRGRCSKDQSAVVQRVCR